MYRINEDRQAFRDKFIEFAKSADYGSFLKDEDLDLMISSSGLKIVLADAKIVICSLEKKLGKFFKKRFYRERGEGYRVLYPNEQVETAINSGKRKVQKAFKQTRKRLKHTDLDKLPEPVRIEVQRRIDSLASAEFIIKNSVFKPQLDLKNISLLSHVRDEIKELTAKSEQKKSVI